jgi:hypothetical protein
MTAGRNGDRPGLDNTRVYFILIDQSREEAYHFVGDSDIMRLIIP